MDTFLIHLSKVKTSADSALETKAALEKINIFPELFEGTYGTDAERLFQEEKRILREAESLPKMLKTNSIKIQGPGAKGVFHSHFRLWNYCVTINKPIMVFEDDVVIVREYEPLEFNEILILSINCEWKMTTKWRHFLYETNQLPTAQDYTEPFMPGTSGYIIKPAAAKKLIDYYNNTNTFIVSDVAVSSDIVNMQIHPRLIGRSKTLEEKQSLVSFHGWETLLK
jgi:GR25 family glycosyltransferase involved in LPS biosynthesis